MDRSWGSTTVICGGIVQWLRAKLWSESAWFEAWRPYLLGV